MDSNDSLETNTLGMSVDRRLKGAHVALEQNEGTAVLNVTPIESGYKVLGVTTEARIRKPDERAMVTAGFNDKRVAISCAVPADDANNDDEVRIVTWSRGKESDMQLYVLKGGGTRTMAEEIMEMAPITIDKDMGAVEAGKARSVLGAAYKLLNEPSDELRNVDAGRINAQKLDLQVRMARIPLK